MFIRKGEREKIATTNANKNTIDQIKGTVDDADQEGRICRHFLRASQIQPRSKKFEVWDPEPVEVEIPLMEGEPYPEII